MSKIRDKKRRFVVQHFARMTPGDRMKVVIEMSEITRKLQEGVKASCRMTP